MFNRRFLRIKVFQQLYAYTKDSQANATVHEKNLFKSLEKTNELYLYLLSLPVAFRAFALKQLDLEATKFYPSELSMNPFKSIAENKAILKLEQCEYLSEKVKSYKLSWTNKDEFFKSIWQQLKTNSFFESYEGKDSHTFFEDRKALNEMMQVFIGESELLNSYLEEIFINWEDDQVVVTQLVLKSIDQMKEISRDEFVSKPGNDDEDLTFMKQLFRFSVEHDEELTTLIGAKTQNWEPERIAVADMLMMKLALCEILYFPYIPVKVSINEYLELAKLYSTPNSHGFINGILDKIQIDLRKQNKVEKLGRGLVE